MVEKINSGIETQEVDVEYGRILRELGRSLLQSQSTSYKSVYVKLQAFRL